MHIVNGAGHFPHQEQPAYCNKLIYKFVEGIICTGFLQIYSMNAEFVDAPQEVQTCYQLEKEANNNEGSSLYMSVGKLMNLTSSTNTLEQPMTATTTTMTTLTTTDGKTPTLTKIEELDNTVAVPEQQTSIIWRPVSALKVYGTNVLSSYKEPFDSAIESSSSVFCNGATVIANNVMKIYHSEEYY